LGDASSYDAIIIGGGPGGLTAGLYLARAGKKTLLLEQTLLGGQIAQTKHVENYPGFPDGITGRELIDLFERQAVRFGLEIQFGRVDGLTVDGEWKQVSVSGFPFRSRVVVLATGLIQRLGISGEEEFLGRGVSYCATCDGALYRQRPAAVVGGSDWAMEEAHFLTRFAQPLYLVVPGGGVKRSNDVRVEVLDHPSVEVVAGARPVEILGDAAGVQALRVNVEGSAGPLDLAVEGVFICAGKKRPGTAFLGDLVETDADGFLQVDECCETRLAGVYAVGDVRRRRFHQVGTAVGDGTIAGMDALRHLKQARG
jgi:thioredoxin reductase (NADPH)